MLLPVLVIIVIAVAFDYTNGFHDAANAIATSVSTRALTPRVALLIAAFGNLFGSLLSTGVAQTVGAGIIRPPAGKPGLLLIFSALLGAITWNLVTWYFGLPSSSSHALIGGLIGAALAANGTVYWSGVLDKVLLPMIIAPLIGFSIAFVLMVVLRWVLRRGNPSQINRGFRTGQMFSAAALAVGHGLQDAQKTMGVVTLALVIGGFHEGKSIPLWVKLMAAAAISLGTYAGGYRIMRTLGRRVIKLDPPRGFVADMTAASVLYTTAFVWKAPISTTHVISSGIMGVGATKRLSAVRWGVAGNIMTAWVLTLPAAALVAAIFHFVLSPFFG